MTTALSNAPFMGVLLRDDQVSGLFSEGPFLSHMLAFERAWTLGLIALGAVSAEDGEAALKALDRFQPDPADLGRGCETDGLPVPALVKQMRKGLPDQVKTALHSGATSQDVIDSAMILTCRDVLAIFETRLQGILEQLAGLETQFADGAMMGRTRMQAALPIVVGDRLRLWRDALQGRLSALPALREACLQVQTGGAVGLRDRPQGQGDEMAAHMARALGLRSGPVWHTDRAAIVTLGHWMSLLSGSLGKLGADVTLMAQQGIDEIALEGAGGSSAMPHKQNPIRAEALITLARYVAGQQGILASAMVHEQERSGTAWALEWMVLPAICEATGAGLNRTSELLDQVVRLGRI